MFRSALGRVLAVFLVLGGAGVCVAEPPGPDELDVPFDAVLRRKSDVFASSAVGIFRADLEGKNWKRLKLPAEMPSGGRFGVVPEGSEQILYYGQAGRYRGEGKRSGIYCSVDSGETWNLLSAN